MSSSQYIGRFFPRKLTDDQVADVALVRGDFVNLTERLDVRLPEGREKSLVMTKLEEACMFAVAAVSRREDT